MSEYQHIVHTLEPVYNQYSHVLILGSLPSALSREQNFYYGNPQNRFWKVIAACCHEDVPTHNDIAAKRELLLRHNIALWDVIASCDIRGSSDASIKNVVPNNVAQLLKHAPIEHVVCNGRTAATLYEHWLKESCKLSATAMPSTSPANARWTLDSLIARWKDEL